MKKIKEMLPAAGLILLFIAGLVLLGRAGQKTEQTADLTQNADSALIAGESFFNFGEVSMARGTVTHAYTIRNTSNAPVTIRKVTTSCMCTEATLILGEKRFGPYGMPGHGLAPSVNATLAPGQEATVEVVFDPAAHGPAGVGRADRIVFVEDATGLVLQLNFTATVTP